MRALSEGLIQMFERQAATEGKRLPSNFRRIAAEISGQSISYEELVAYMADAYARYFTDDDLRVILAYQRTPTYQKQLEIAPKLLQESMEWAQRILASRKNEIQVKIAARLQETNGTPAR